MTDQSFEKIPVRKVMDIALIVGFLGLDWLRFHDIFKPEAPTVADWLTGALSVLVFYLALESLVGAGIGRAGAVK